VDPLTWFPRHRAPTPLTPLGVILLTIFGLLLLIALALVLGGCAFTYDGATGSYRGAVACVNISGPGISWTCPETLQAPTIPNPPQPNP